MLAGLVKSPSRLAPTHNPDGAQRRGQIVLAAMADIGVVSDHAAKAALADSPRIVRQVMEGSGNYVADWVMDVLNDLVGRVEHDIVVETTIDSSLQTIAEKALADELAQKGERYAVGQGAVVAFQIGLECLGVFDVTMRKLHRQILHRVPRDAPAIGIEARPVEIVAVFIRLAAGENAAFKLDGAPLQSSRGDAERDVSRILPVMRSEER